MKQHWTYWHLIVESESPKWKKGDIIGLAKRTSKIIACDESNPENWEGFCVRFKYIGKLVKSDDAKNNYLELIKLCKEMNVVITDEMNAWAKKNIKTYEG